LDFSAGRRGRLRLCRRLRLGLLRLHTIRTRGEGDAAEGVHKPAAAEVRLDVVAAADVAGKRLLAELVGVLAEAVRVDAGDADRLLAAVRDVRPTAERAVGVISRDVNLLGRDEGLAVAAANVEGVVVERRGDQGDAEVWTFHRCSSGEGQAADFAAA